MRTIIVLALILLATPASARYAFQCSDTALIDIAVANPIDPEDRIVDAAFNKCIAEWETEAKAALAHPEFSTSSGMPSTSTLSDVMSYAREHYRRVANVKVIEMARTTTDVSALRYRFFPGNPDECSDAALVEFAVANPMEPAERIAALTFEKCIEKWREEAEEIIKADYSRPMRNILPTADAWVSFERDRFRREGIAKVIEARAGARRPK
ncbi:hypothetical protein [Bradyrhizobium sp. RDI18]|uniref:hypothetical protein n=1 Tax=Bradyrhizobium sp. RDI18 TaxID=3367400 RepID=UPI003722456A